MLQPTTKLSPWLYKSYFSPPLYTQEGRLLPGDALYITFWLVNVFLSTDFIHILSILVLLSYIMYIQMTTFNYIYIYKHTYIVTFWAYTVCVCTVQHILYRSVTLDVCTVDNGCTWRLIDIRQKCFLIPSRQIYLFSHDPIYIAKKEINYYDCLFEQTTKPTSPHLPPDMTHVLHTLGWC